MLVEIAIGAAVLIGALLFLLACALLDVIGDWMDGRR